MPTTTKLLFLLDLELWKGEQPVNENSSPRLRLRSAYHDPAFRHRVLNFSPDPAQAHCAEADQNSSRW
jgi:hypothetical protein